MTRSVELDAAPAAVWDALTEAALLGEWLADEVSRGRAGRRDRLPLRRRRGTARRGRAGRGGRTGPGGGAATAAARAGSNWSSTRSPSVPPDGDRDRPVRSMARCFWPTRAPGARRWPACGSPSASSSPGHGAGPPPAERRRGRRGLRRARRSDPPPPGRGARPSGGATATGLAAELPISRQAVAKHLAILGRAGLVSHSRHGREHRFELDPRPSPTPPHGSRPSAPSGTSASPTCSACSNPEAAWGRLRIKSSSRRLRLNRRRR